MGVVCWLTNGFIEQDLFGTEGIIQRIANVFTPIAFSVLALAGMYKVLKVAEFDDILNIFKRRFRNK